MAVVEQEFRAAKNRSLTNDIYFPNLSSVLHLFLQQSNLQDFAVLRLARHSVFGIRPEVQKFAKKDDLDEVFSSHDCFNFIVHCSEPQSFRLVEKVGLKFHLIDMLIILLLKINKVFELKRQSQYGKEGRQRIILNSDNPGRYAMLWQCPEQMGPIRLVTLVITQGIT